MLSLLGAGQGQNYDIQNIINQFKARVSADNGVFEAEACLYATLTELNSIA
jgi:hypothetical protein